MKPYRNLKLASLIQEELSKLIAREFDFNGAFVTITNVVMNEKLEEARVSLSILPYERGPEVFYMIENARHTLQHQLLKKMRIRVVPQLRFMIDQPK